MSCSHDHQQHCAGTSLVLIHFRDLNAFALHIVIFYRSFSFFFFFFFFLSFFFPFFLFFFLHTDLNIPGRTSLNLLPVPKCGGGSSADVVSSSTLLNFPCIRHKCHVTSWGLAILLVFPFRKKKETACSHCSQIWNIFLGHSKGCCEGEGFDMTAHLLKDNYHHWCSSGNLTRS